MITSADVRSGTKPCGVCRWIRQLLKFKTFEGNRSSRFSWTRTQSSKDIVACVVKHLTKTHDCTAGRIDLAWADYHKAIRDRGWRIYMYYDTTGNMASISITKGGKYSNACKKTDLLAIRAVAEQVLESEEAIE